MAITHVCYRNGAKVDVEGVVRLARAKGALVLLDFFQSVGTEAIDVKALGVDFAVGGMLKYLLGTAGVGFLYVRRELIEALVPTASGWFAQADVDAMDIFANDPSPTARRFQAGTPPVPNCYAAEAGIGLIRELGVRGDRGAGARRSPATAWTACSRRAARSPPRATTPGAAPRWRSAPPTPTALVGRARRARRDHLLAATATSAPCSTPTTTRATWPGWSRGCRRTASCWPR